MPVNWRHRRRRSPINERAALAAALMLAATGHARPQVLDLGGSLAPPPLNQFTYSNELVGVLENEMAELLAEQSGTGGVPHATLQARINLRIIAADLLSHGDAAGPSGSVAVVAGATLADGRFELDGALAGLPAMHKLWLAEQRSRPEEERQGVEQRLELAMIALNRFNDDASRLATSVQTADPVELGRRLPAILMAAAELIALLERATVESYWPTRDEIAAVWRGERPRVVNPAPTARPSATIGQLTVRIESGEVPPRTAAELEEIIAQLRRAEAFPDLRPTVEQYRRRLSRVLDYCDDLARADWLSEAARAAYVDRLHHGVMLFKNAPTRPRGERQLDRLEASRVLIARITQLQQTEGQRLQPIIDALTTADSMIDNAAEAEQGQRQLQRLQEVVDRMIQYRELPETDLRQQLRKIESRLHQAYRRAEATLLEALAEIAGDPDALTDPAFSSLIQDQSQLVDDLLRLRKIPVWIDTLSLMNPKAAGSFSAQTRKMANWLLDPNRRPDAIVAMEQFEQQLALFYPLPFERELRAGQPLAEQATGGLRGQYVQVIDHQRREWAKQWGEGNAAGPAAERLLLLYRLNQTMLDTANVFALRGDAGQLNDWAMWHLSSDSIATAVSELPSRLKLATASAIEGNDAALVQHLELMNLDAPLAKLVGRLARALREPLGRRPGGATSVLGQLVSSPTDETWLVDRRLEVAGLCRYALEEEHARAIDQIDLAEMLVEYVNHCAERLLLDLGDRPVPLPSLIGFDGSDPIPSDTEPKRRRRR